MGIRIVPITKDSDAKRRKKTIQGIKGTPKEYSTSRTTTQKGIMKPNASYAVDRGVLSPRFLGNRGSKTEFTTLRKAAEKK